MSYIVPKEIPNCCGRCPCFHAEKLMYCQAVKVDKNKRIYAPYGEGRPDWCPLIEVPTPHGRLIDADAIQDYNVETFGQRLLIIDTAPTVIEAERSEE